jgi:hypothetical protein
MMIEQMAITPEQEEFLKSLEHCDLRAPTRVQSRARQQCRLEGLATFRNRQWRITQDGRDALAQPNRI